ncbi:restriction endonuclease [Streptomyces sp. NBC_01367]|uniref:restriction endonuclease n=1 Tax=Streptomyces sp. NBC_01367 TaxID=2903841 RepID=UPI003243BD61
MLRAFLWVSEVRIAVGLAREWRSFLEQVTRERTEAEHRRDSNAYRSPDQVTEVTWQVARKLVKHLGAEEFEAQHALAECEAAAGVFGSQLGKDLRLQEERLSDLRAALSGLRSQLSGAKKRLDSLLEKDRKRLRQIAEIEMLKRQASTDAGTSLHQLDQMTQQDFEQAVREATQRSGFEVVHYEPRMIEVKRGGSKGIIFCEHGRHPTRDEYTSIEQIVTAQRLASERGHSSVLVITNLRFVSHPAHRFMQGRHPKVQLVQRFELQRWIEWGVPLDSLVKHF